MLDAELCAAFRRPLAHSDARVCTQQVPLDWTGKPIPYWLYKLHGLNIEYKCEICGNYSYWGPRAFERHFQVLIVA